MEVLHMAGAYYEKIARINLTTGEIKVEPLDLRLTLGRSNGFSSSK